MSAGTSKEKTSVHDRFSLLSFSVVRRMSSASVFVCRLLVFFFANVQNHTTHNTTYHQTKGFVVAGRLAEDGKPDGRARGALDLLDGLGDGNNAHAVDSSDGVARPQPLRRRVRPGVHRLNLALKWPA